MIPSVYQQTIFEEVLKGKTGDNLVIEAKAGSGKTTTIVSSLQHIGSFDSVLFLAFNKSIATELQKRVPSNVAASTFNSFGYKVYRENTKGYVKISADKVKNVLLYDVLEGYLGRTLGGRTINNGNKYSFLRPVTQTIDLMKSYCLDDIDDPQVLDIIDKYNIDGPDGWMDVLRETWEKESQKPNVIDFNDQLYIPVKLDYAFPRYDWVFVDESQDLNRCQIEILKRIQGSPRYIFVGDSNQAIYGFRGADTGAIKLLKNTFNCKVLPLSISYRCAKNVIIEAQKIVPEIEYSPTAEDGSVKGEPFVPFEGDYILCRTTAPLVKSCLQLIRSGKKATVLGREIGTALIELHRRVSAIGKDYFSCIQDYKSMALEKYKSKENRLSAILDQLDTLEALYEYDHDVELAIEYVFSEETANFTFSTIHKAKGLEANRVWLLRPDLVPHPSARSEWEMEQEKNLHYVAITRARKEFIYVR